MNFKGTKFSADQQPIDMEIITGSTEQKWNRKQKVNRRELLKTLERETGIEPAGKEVTVPNFADWEGSSGVPLSWRVMCRGRQFPAEA